MPEKPTGRTIDGQTTCKPIHCEPTHKDYRFYYMGGIYPNKRVAILKEAANTLGIQMISLTGSGGTTEDGVKVKENETQIEVRTMSADECTKFWTEVDKISSPKS